VVLGGRGCRQLLGIIETYVVQYLGWTVTNNIRLDLIVHCLGLDMNFHKTHSPGEMIERIDGDVGQLATFFSNFITNLLGNVLMLLGMMIVLLFIDWRIGLALVGLVVLSIPIVGPMQRKLCRTGSSCVKRVPNISGSWKNG
jgi:ABC-type multidrug transport system fused ATPase/permease subunit